MSRLSSYEISEWDPGLTEEDREGALTSLESGDVLYFPQLGFSFRNGEDAVFSTDWSVGAKDIGYHPETGKLTSVKAEIVISDRIAAAMRRYSELTFALVQALFPEYRPQIKRTGTSFRTMEVSGHPGSAQNNDTFLHVDSCPFAPAEGERILGVYCNVNPDGQKRTCLLGEPFETYAERFAPRVKKPLLGSRGIMSLLRLTKTKGTLYDHYMLALNDLAKKDTEWQQSSPRVRIDFPAGSTWMCFTDQVVHAAVSGRYALEQTYRMPVRAMRDPERSPLRVLERITGSRLVREV